MNNARRAQLKSIRADLDALKERLVAVRDDEQEAYDGLPDSLRESERGTAMDEALGELDSADNALDEAISSIETAIGG